MSKYEFRGTPGPWRVLSSKVDVVSDSAPGNNVVVCRTGSYGQQGDETDETRERWEKDAQAISAVPELIEALRELLEACHAEPNMEQERRQAVAALSEATGERAGGGNE